MAHSSRRAVALLARAAVSAGLLALLLGRADPGVLAERFASVHVGWPGTALGVYGAIIWLSAWRWQRLRCRWAAPG